MNESAILHKSFMRDSEVAGAIKGMYESLHRGLSAIPLVHLSDLRLTRPWYKNFGI